MHLFAITRLYLEDYHRKYVLIKQKREALFYPNTEKTSLLDRLVRNWASALVRCLQNHISWWRYSFLKAVMYLQWQNHWGQGHHKVHNAHLRNRCAAWHSSSSCHLTQRLRSSIHHHSPPNVNITHWWCDSISKTYNQIPNACNRLWPFFLCVHSSIDFRRSYMNEANQWSKPALELLQLFKFAGQLKQFCEKGCVHEDKSLNLLTILLSKTSLYMGCRRSYFMTD